MNEVRTTSSCFSAARSDLGSSHSGPLRQYAKHPLTALQLKVLGSVHHTSGRSSTGQLVSTQQLCQCSVPTTAKSVGRHHGTTSNGNNHSPLVGSSRLATQTSCHVDKLSNQTSSQKGLHLVWRNSSRTTPQSQVAPVYAWRVSGAHN